MRPKTLVLTNDDGIDADGLRALEAVAARLFPEARRVVVAPDRCHSQCGHAFITERSLGLTKIGADRFSCDGTPVDCVRLALFGLDLNPDLVLSGINHGGNLGHDLAASGTVAAAREAAWHGVTAVALSHYHRRGLDFDWEIAIERAAMALEQLLDASIRGTGPLLQPGDHASVNLPHTAPPTSGVESPCPRLIECHPEPGPLSVAYERGPDTPDETVTLTYRYTGSYADRPRSPGSDVQVCFDGDISWCRLRLPL